MPTVLGPLSFFSSNTAHANVSTTKHNTYELKGCKLPGPLAEQKPSSLYSPSRTDTNPAWSAATRPQKRNGATRRVNSMIPGGGGEGLITIDALDRELENEHRKT